MERKFYGLSALTPENALRDCYLYAHKTEMWCFEEDDLDLPENGTPLKTRLAGSP
ncbi:hypothetical protein EBME_2005 [bacterium endosymbiont of Mortierella elongata FMR23-6]|nr:hypothetical protein EBME_2005 [bacterium endosymbiont of Mortierella elongata FMR23-6]